jgi:pyruvate-formate lyase-activating enzyme
MPNLLCAPRVFDLEVTNLCNTVCAFCPRDALKRPKGRMTQATFEQFLTRLKAYAQRIEGQMMYLYLEKTQGRAGRGEQSPILVVMCGMGECLTHEHAPEWIGRIRSELGINAGIVTNGALLDEAMVKRLIAARVSVVAVSIHGIDKASYSRYVKLDWDLVMKNLMRAHQMMPGRVAVSITIPADAPFTREQVIAFWQARGIPLWGIYACHNRGGFLTNEALITKKPAIQTPQCGTLTKVNFVTWEGRVISCCHDLLGQNVLGDLREVELSEIAVRKTRLLAAGPKFPICRVCDEPDRGNLSGIFMVEETILCGDPASLAKR